jgi:hypothetical protein
MTSRQIEEVEAEHTACENLKGASARMIRGQANVKPSTILKDHKSVLDIRPLQVGRRMYSMPTWYANGKKMHRCVNNQMPKKKPRWYMRCNSAHKTEDFVLGRQP